MAEVTEVLSKVKSILDKVISLYAEHNVPIDEFTQGNGQLKRVYKCPASEVLLKLTKLSTKGTLGEGDIQIKCDSYLGRNKFEYVTEDGFKFAFAAVKGNTIELHFRKVSNTDLPGLDDISDIDLDI